MRSTDVLRPLLPCVLVVSAAVAACGGGGGAATGSNAPPSAPGSTPAAASGDAGIDSDAAPPSAATAGTNATRPIAPSAMLEELKAIGLDPAALPPLGKLPPDKLRKVMKTFTKALGTTCNGCHDGNDFHKPTPHKKVASKMWDLYVRGLRMADGTPLYCDSCHGGKQEFLDRKDHKALAGWMDENFVKKVKRADGKAHDCATCHGDPFQAKIIEAWEK